MAPKKYLTDEELRQLIEHIIVHTFGHTVDHKEDQSQDMIFLRNSRKLCESIFKKTWLTIFMGITSGIMWLVWDSWNNPK